MSRSPFADRNDYEAYLAFISRPRSDRPRSIKPVVRFNPYLGERTPLDLTGELTDKKWEPLDSDLSGFDDLSFNNSTRPISEPVVPNTIPSTTENTPAVYTTSRDRSPLQRRKQKTSAFMEPRYTTNRDRDSFQRRKQKISPSLEARLTAPLATTHLNPPPRKKRKLVRFSEVTRTYEY